MISDTFSLHLQIVQDFQIKIIIIYSEFIAFFLLANYLINRGMDLNQTQEIIFWFTFTPDYLLESRISLTQSTGFENNTNGYKTVSFTDILLT